MIVDYFLGIRMPPIDICFCKTHDRCPESVNNADYFSQIVGVGLNLHPTHILKEYSEGRLAVVWANCGIITMSFHYSICDISLGTDEIMGSSHTRRRRDGTHGRSWSNLIAG